MLIGYARVSTASQDPTAQREALREAGCLEEYIFIDQVSGSRSERPELRRMLDALRPADMVVVTRLDRLSRSLRDLLRITEEIQEAGANLRSLNEAINTNTPAGRMMLQLVGVFAEFELAQIRERTREGLEAARRSGKRLGRPRALNKRQRGAALDLIRQGHSQASVAEIFGVSRSTVCRLVAAASLEESSKVL